MQDMGRSGSLGFGNRFTPHMAISRWLPEDNWSPVEMVSHTMLSLAPSALVLHYGQAVFEGLKAYIQSTGLVSMFRPRRCAERFNKSAARLSMPALPEEMFIAACENLIRADIAHVPTGPGQTLYLRPFMIATEASINVRASQEYLFGVIASPVDSYFASGISGIDAWCSEEYVRATAGGTGAVKFAGNYAPCLTAKAEAARHGCQEVLWLDAVERRWVEEMSAMNFFCVSTSTGGTAELVTPPLAGTILDGNTRDSILRLARRRGIQTTQRPVALAELIESNSTVSEAFACGTAATVVPVIRITTSEGSRGIGNGAPGALTMQLRHELVAIQDGRAPDEFGWMHEVCRAVELQPISR